MTLAEILCTCGARFSVRDDGRGSPHACPQCRIQNVLPRLASLDATPPPRGAETAVRSTRVLSRTSLSVKDAIMGLPPGMVLGPYRIVDRVGKGGMGSVYEAVDDSSGQRVALKVLSPELAQRPDFVARFQRESRALGELSDPRIAKVFFSGAADGLPFFAMEFVEGRNLEELLAQEGPLGAARATTLMTEAAIGLAAAADHGLIHRDVKPTNILVDDAGNVRLVDFGLAKTMDSESRLTVTGAVVGTPYYLSPEQGLGRQVDVRSDIYSLGATFYHLLAGEPPFEAESPVSIIMRHVNDAPELLSRRRPDLKEPLVRVVMRCMAKDPARRYQDWDELLEDLEAVRSGEPVAAPPEEVSVSQKRPATFVMDDLDEGSRVLRRATRLRRAIGFAVDFGFLAVVWAVVERLLFRFGGPPALPVMLPAGLLYVALGDGLGGRSFGKRFASLRVARPDGAAPGILPAALRALLCLPAVMLVAASQGVGTEELSVLPYLGAGAAGALLKAVYGLLAVDLGLSLFTRRAETLHDLVSGTGVFREQRIKKKKRAPRRRAKDLLKLKRPPRPATPLRPEDLPHPLGPTLASLFVPGLGQLWNDQGGKGIVFFVGLVLALVIADDTPIPCLIIWGFNILDANRMAHRRIRAARSVAAGGSAQSGN